jgi:hypothetical protein
VWFDGVREIAAQGCREVERLVRANLVVQPPVRLGLGREVKGVGDLEAVQVLVLEYAFPWVVVDSVPPAEAARYLRELGATWEAAHGDSGRRMLAEALFQRIEVRGFREMTLRLTEDAIAHGFAAVLPERLGICVSGRGERHTPATTDLPITMRLAEPPEPFDWLRSA